MSDLTVKLWLGAALVLYAVIGIGLYRLFVGS